MNIYEYEMTPDLIVEAKGKTVFPESVHFRARALKLDVPTANGRVYKKGLIEREIKRLMDSPTSIFGASRHPEKGTAEIPDISHLISKLEVGPDGYLWAEGEILDTQKGRDLKAIIAANGRVGLSLRGSGKVDEKTGLVDEESYRLHSIDAVLRPASEGAHLSKDNVFESVQFEPASDIDAEQELCARINEAIQAGLTKVEKKLRPLVEAELNKREIAAVELVDDAIKETEAHVRFVLVEAERAKIVTMVTDQPELGHVKNLDEQSKDEKRNKAIIREARAAGSTLTDEEILAPLKK